MLSWVSPKVEVRHADARGDGTFAIAPITRDEVVIVQGGKAMDYAELEASEFGKYDDHCYQVDGDVVIGPTRPEEDALDGVCKVNHSCEPSCGFRGQIVLVAMRDIAVGEEINYDYAMTDADWGTVKCRDMECLCGEPACRKVVGGSDWKRPELRERYTGYFSTFVQGLIDRED